MNSNKARKFKEKESYGKHRTNFRRIRSEFLGLYLAEFIDFVDNVLPSIDPEIKNKAKAAIEQFNNSGNTFEYFTPKILPELSQGDIISEILFCV